MILRYGIENFYSFRDPTVVDFSLRNQAGEPPGSLVTGSGVRVNAVTAVFGGNASGKTNLLKPLGFLAWFLLGSAQRKPGEPIPFEPFHFTSNRQNTPTRLMLEFEIPSGHYRYEVELTPDRVLCETLQRKKNRFAFLFDREWDDEKQDYDFKSQDIGPAAFVPLRENASWLASALLQEHPFAVELRPFFESFYGNLDIHGRTPVHDAEMLNVMKAARFYDENPALLDRASELLAGFDLGLSGVRIERYRFPTPEGKEVETPVPLGIHRPSTNPQPFLLPFTQESRGTQALFVLLYSLLPVLDRGGIAFIDEFESGLHPHMIEAVLGLFFNPATNPNQAQLIATFHSDYLLRETLHKYQIHLVEKNEDLVSETWRLDSVKGVRNVDNIYEKYHAGAYGGVPSLP